MIDKFGGLEEQFNCTHLYYPRSSLLWYLNNHLKGEKTLLVSDGWRSIKVNWIKDIIRHKESILKEFGGNGGEEKESKMWLMYVRKARKERRKL